MRRVTSREIRRVAVASFFALAASSLPACAASLLEKNFWLEGPRYHAQLPHCETPAALDRIATTFAQRESRYWNSALKIVEFLGVREIAFRAWAVDTIPRRFCSGTVVISSGSIIRSSRTPGSLARPGASRGASSGSIATGPIIQLAG
jgi:hypothetical protein